MFPSVRAHLVRVVAIVVCWAVSVFFFPTLYRSCISIRNYSYFDTLHKYTCVVGVSLCSAIETWHASIYPYTHTEKKLRAFLLCALDRKKILHTSKWVSHAEMHAWILRILCPFATYSTYACSTGKMLQNAISEHNQRIRCHPNGIVIIFPVQTRILCVVTH